MLIAPSTAHELYNYHNNNQLSVKDCSSKQPGAKTYEVIYKNGMQRKSSDRRSDFMAEQGNCDTCVNFVYDEDYEYYVCDMDLDEDDMVRFLTGNTNSCPYYQLYDEYKIVRHQM